MVALLARATRLLSNAPQTLHLPVPDGKHTKASTAKYLTSVVGSVRRVLPEPRLQ
jgi:hypothetical protein